MENFDAIVEAGQMAEMSNTKQSRGVANYYLNEVSMQADQLPVMSYGLQLNRLAEAPPTAVVRGQVGRRGATEVEAVGVACGEAAQLERECGLVRVEDAERAQRSREERRLRLRPRRKRRSVYLGRRRRRRSSTRR
mgnify:CR=1 FL=1